MLIAVVDDDTSAQCVLQAALVHAGYKVQIFSDGLSFLNRGFQADLGLLVVDWQLPDMQGPAVVQAARQLYGAALPILFATQRQQEQDVVHALQAGADDFMSKPLQLPIFMARVQALIRRSSTVSPKQTVQFGPYVFEPDGHHVRLAAQCVALTEREYRIALYLFQHEGLLIPRQELLRLFWPRSNTSNTASLDTHIFRIRSKLQLGSTCEAGAAHNICLVTIYNTGYRLQHTHTP